MEIEKIGELFIDGKIVNIDSMSCDLLESELKILEDEKTNIIGKLNKILLEI